MPADKRLWMPFPNDFWMHPKIRVLSDSAFRTFVELIGYSRMQDLDGVIPTIYARREWKAKALTELQNNHPERPSLVLDGDNFIIWNYAEHQETRASREKRQRTNRANGSLGGRPPKQNPVETESVSKKNPERTELKPESEVEIENYNLGASSYVPDAPTGHDDGPRFPKPLRGGGLDLNRVDAAVAKFCQRTASEPQLQAIVDAVMGRATGAITSMTSYVVKGIENDWGEWQAFIDSGRAAA